MYTLTSVNTHLAAGMHKHTVPSRNVFEKMYVLIPSQLHACAPRRTRLPKTAQRTSFCVLLTAVTSHSYIDLRLNSFSLCLILEDFSHRCIVCSAVDSSLTKALALLLCFFFLRTGCVCLTGNACNDSTKVRLKEPPLRLS